MNVDAIGRLSVLVALMAISELTAVEPDLPLPNTRFLSNNCLDCHDGEDGEGGFNVAMLLTEKGIDLNDPKTQHSWIRVFDRINDDEMPPAEFGEVEQQPKERFLAETHSWINGFLNRQHRNHGRVGARRLTNDQLERTLCDLLAVDVPLARLIPEEPRTDGFRNIADAQSMSHYHLQDHLRVVDEALEAAIDRLDDQDPRVIDFPPTRIANKPPGRRNRDPEMRKGLAVVWKSTMSFYGRISNSVIRESGWYRITVTASSVNQPDDRGVWCSVRSGRCTSSAPLMNWIGEFEATNEPNEFSYTAWIDKDHLLEIRPGDATLKNARFQGGQVGFGEGESQKVPGVAMHRLRIERIFPGGNVDQVRRQLFGDLDVRFDRSKRKWQLTSESIGDDLQRQVTRFAESAFRRSVDQNTLQPYLDSVDQLLADGMDPLQVLRQTYRAILCSPRFLYFQEQPGKLDDHAIANRLSYLLTGTAPDDELRRLAVAGRLQEKKVIVQQTRRLLASDSLDHFVADFADQWLDLADIGFTEPDRRVYRDFDLVIQSSMVEETRRFLKTLIRENRPAHHLVHSDFTWLNSRLANYYGIESDISPSQWQLVSLLQHPRRGGLMTHGSVLKVTANGTNTSPVVRGAWICDRLLGIPIPDPPENVPAIEPDIRGASTIREMLEKHRSNTDCASCHSKIDPAGFALEHFDAAGRWRNEYVSRGRKTAKIDSSYLMPDGRPFESFTEFRELASENSRSIGKNFAAKLLVYGTGREITFSDREALDKIADQAEPNQYALRSIIEAVVTSAPFLNK